MSRSEQRERIRIAYDFRCGYCGVREEDAGSELEIDHYQPRAAGGTDDDDNLVYCCTTCNRIKGDHWADSGNRRLLHPQIDDSVDHVQEEADGRLLALTGRGEFHVRRLKLNRPPLVALRRARREQHAVQKELTQARHELNRRGETIRSLESALQRVFAQVAELLRDLRT